MLSVTRDKEQVLLTAELPSMFTLPLVTLPSIDSIGDSLNYNAVTFAYTTLLCYTSNLDKKSLLYCIKSLLCLNYLIDSGIVLANKINPIQFHCQYL